MGLLYCAHNNGSGQNNPPPLVQEERNMSQYTIKPGRLGRRIIRAYKAVENRFVRAFLQPDGSLRTGAAGDKVVRAYKRVETAVVNRYKGIETAFVDAFLEKKTNPEKPSGHFPGQGSDRS